MLTLDVRANLSPVQRGLIALRADQVPFATSLMLNTLANGVAEIEEEDLERTFDNPTPFTRRAYRIQVATKSRPIAIVAAKDIQAQYLAPYVVGGERFLGTKKAMLAPRAIKTNQYGNLPRGKLAALKAKPGVFIGSVTFKKSGKTINGVWQRNDVKRGTRRDGSYGTKGAHSVVGGARTTLKLLIQFEDTTQVRKRLKFYERARTFIERNARAAFDDAMRRALATARS